MHCDCRFHFHAGDEEGRRSRGLTAA
jgi:hypothetical protein